MVGILWIALTSAGAHGAPGETDPEQLFEEGRALAKAGKYAEACSLFAKSLELDHTVGTELNLADCREQLGQLRDAWVLFSAAAEESERTADTKRSKFARDRANAVAARLATVTLKVTAADRAGLAITIAGRTARPEAVISEHLDPGIVEVTASLAGHPRFATSIRAIGGATLVVEIPAFTESEEPVSSRSLRSRRVYLAWGLAGGAGLGAIATTIVALKARNDYNAAASGPHCRPVSDGVTCDDMGTESLHDAQHLADIGTVIGAGCGLLLVASAIVYITAPTEPMKVTPVATGHGVAVMVSGRF